MGVSVVFFFLFYVNTFNKAARRELFYENTIQSMMLNHVDRNTAKRMIKESFEIESAEDMDLPNFWEIPMSVLFYEKKIMAMCSFGLVAILMELGLILRHVVPGLCDDEEDSSYQRREARGLHIGPHSFWNLVLLAIGTVGVVGMFCIVVYDFRTDPANHAKYVRVFFGSFCVYEILHTSLLLQATQRVERLLAATREAQAKSTQRAGKMLPYLDGQNVSAQNFVMNPTWSKLMMKYCVSNLVMIFGTALFLLSVGVGQLISTWPENPNPWEWLAVSALISYFLLMESLVEFD